MGSNRHPLDGQVFRKGCLRHYLVSVLKQLRISGVSPTEVNLPPVSDREQVSTPQDRNSDTAESLEGAYIARRLRANAPVCRLSAKCIESRYI